ncbi:M23 family metallopeptidase [Herbiconiux sp. SYSU D00978]|uniref:M23 family metallopeptidase n=1 Tax=Herbiconiux sp. SYSU D00978 TaxID=2812562 RepID=UPI001A95E86C|nr:M23 family metallopeptidase [Herbiconiux sp. SYSU D00978]
MKKTHRNRLIASAAAFAVALSASLFGASPAWAERDYPTWDEVEAARANESAQQALISELEGFITQLQGEVAAAEAEAQRKGEEYAAAQEAYDTAAYEADQLQAEADAAQVKADESMSQAGQLIAQLARSGGVDMSANLFLSGEEADDLLYQLGAMSQVTQQADGIYTRAVQDKNDAQQRTEQAKVARDALQALAEEAQRLLEEAQAAASAAQSKLDEQLEYEVQMEAQLSVLRENRAATEADYQAGVEYRAEQARIKAEEERKAREAAAAAAAAARAAAAAAAAANSGGGSSSGGGGSSSAGGGSSAGGTPVASGWSRPTSGRVTSGYGMRYLELYGYLRMHAGIDFGPGCGAAIFAAADGTVDYAGYLGGSGYTVRINHGGGLTTSYSHIRQGGIAVRVGQSVSSGDYIAAVGTTGNSTGCHLHFEVRQYGDSTDPAAFLRARGVSV